MTNTAIDGCPQGLMKPKCKQTENEYWQCE